MTASELLDVARDLARTPGGCDLVAFYLLDAGRVDEAFKFLAEAGTAGDEVMQIFR